VVLLCFQARRARLERRRRRLISLGLIMLYGINNAATAMMLSEYTDNPAGCLSRRFSQMLQYGPG
jgi:hypothetical protein